MFPSAIELIKRNKVLRRGLFRCQELRCMDFMERFSEYFSNDSRILDVGAGTCNMTHLLQRRGVKTVPLDITDISLVQSIKPVLYDGSEFPFEDDSFDVVLILTVLHHCSDPECVIREARRVAKRVIIIEDVVRGPLHAMLTKATDSILNLEFFGHPHQNKSDQEWIDLFDRCGLQLVHKHDVWSFLVMWQVTYILERS